MTNSKIHYKLMD